MKKFIPVCEPNIGKKEISYVNDAVTSGWVSSNGKYIGRFEKEFAKFCHRKYAEAVCNGTVALHVALLAIGIKKGDEVLVSNITFIATANAVKYIGAKPVLVDVESDTLNIDVEKIENKITKKTKAIMVVHLYGHPCDMDKIMKIAKKHNLFVIEDAAEAHGSFFKKQICGSFGDISCFSFYGNKVITTGEGGMCLTDDPELHKKIKLLRGQGMTEDRRYWHEVVGYNYRMTNMQAALGCAQMERIVNFIKAKRENAKLYKKLLKSEPQIILPIEKPYAKSNFWMFTILLGENLTGKRDEIMEKLKTMGIESRVVFYPLSDMPVYLESGEKLLVSKKMAYRGITLPSSTKLTRSDIKYICDSLKKIISNIKKI